MIASTFNRRFLHLCAILFSAFLLCIVALYNNFPLTFNNDTGVYINSGFTGEVQEDRPIIYGLFLAISSLGHSLWLVVVVQGLIVSLVIYYSFRYIGTNTNFIFYYVGFVALVSLFMGASFEVSWLMPDVFTGAVILCMALLIFCNKLKSRDVTIIALIAVLSISVHNSHFYICILLCCLFLVGYLFKGTRMIYTKAEIKLKKILLIIALAIVSNLTSAAVNNNYGGTFKGSHGGIIFFMSNLVEMGVIDPYLAENCGPNKYTLCAYKDSIPNNFLWSPASPLNKTGGWKANEKEYLRIETDLLTTPKYLFKITYKSALYTIKQFFNYDFAHIKKPSSLVKKSVRRYFPNEYQSYVNSLQGAAEMPFALINYTQNLLVALCLFLYVVVLNSKSLYQKELIIAVFLITAIVLNSWVCSMFSGVYPRYQTRVAWMLPLPLFLHWMRKLEVQNWVKGQLTNFNKLKT